MDDFSQMVEEIRKQSDLEQYRKIVEEGRKLVLFGAGDSGHVVYNILHTVGIAVFCFCDNRLGGQMDQETGL